MALFHGGEERQFDWKSKEKQSSQDLHSSEPQKAHPTNEFSVV